MVIASPNATHAPLATLALNAGKHVVVDKPFTLDMQEARDLIALAEEKQRLLSVFHNRRWDSDFLGIKQIIEQGTLGKVKHPSRISTASARKCVRWREQNVPGSGLWFDLGSSSYRPDAAALWPAAVGSGEYRDAARRRRNQRLGARGLKLPGA